jgi:hypothetical protein
VRASIERYCDHIQRYIISQGATDNGLQESLTQDANQDDKSSREGLGGNLGGGLGAGLGPLDGSLEAIKEGTMEGTVFEVVLDNRIAGIESLDGERPASPGSDKVKLFFDMSRYFTAFLALAAKEYMRSLVFVFTSFER